MRRVHAVREAEALVRTTSPSSRSEHPLLRLQREAGNRATTLLIQRDPDDDSARLRDLPSSKVAIANMDIVYDGKLGADIDGASLTRIWDPGLLASDRIVKLNAGPVSFSWRSAQTRFTGGTFPWAMSTIDGRSAWVMKEVADALSVIYARWAKEDGKFWAAVATLKSLLKTDVDAWRAYRKKHPRRWSWGSSED